MDHAELISKMTDEEKASLCSGADFWHTKGVARLGIPQMMLTDGRTACASRSARTITSA